MEWWRNLTAQLLMRHKLDELVKPLTLFKLLIDARSHSEAGAPAQTLQSTPERVVREEWEYDSRIAC